MTEARLYELLGRKQDALESAIADYGTAVQILRGIKDGSIALDRLTINDNGSLTLAAANQEVK